MGLMILNFFMYNSGSMLIGNDKNSEQTLRVIVGGSERVFVVKNWTEMSY